MFTLHCLESGGWDGKGHCLRHPRTVVASPTPQLVKVSRRYYRDLLLLVVLCACLDYALVWIVVVRLSHVCGMVVWTGHASIMDACPSYMDACVGLTIGLMAYNILPYSFLSSMTLPLSRATISRPRLLPGLGCFQDTHLFRHA